MENKLDGNAAAGTHCLIELLPFRRFLIHLMQLLVFLSSPSTSAFVPLVRPLDLVLVGKVSAEMKAHPDFG